MPKLKNSNETFWVIFKHCGRGRIKNEYAMHTFSIQVKMNGFFSAVLEMLLFFFSSVFFNLVGTSCVSGLVLLEFSPQAQLLFYPRSMASRHSYYFTFTLLNTNLRQVRLYTNSSQLDYTLFENDSKCRILIFDIFQQFLSY